MGYARASFSFHSFYENLTISLLMALEIACLQCADDEFAIMRWFNQINLNVFPNLNQSLSLVEIFKIPNDI